MNTSVFGYEYDPIGNRRWANADAQTNQYIANTLNQYVSVVEGGAPVTPLFYDPDGNLTHDGVHAYAWDAENRLIAAIPLVTTSAPAVCMKYDHMGRRIL